MDSSVGKIGLHVVCETGGLLGRYGHDMVGKVLVFSLPTDDGVCLLGLLGLCEDGHEHTET
jgi:hypothetical protein